MGGQFDGSLSRWYRCQNAATPSVRIALTLPLHRLIKPLQEVFSWVQPYQPFHWFRGYSRLCDGNHSEACSRTARDKCCCRYFPYHSRSSRSSFASHARWCAHSRHGNHGRSTDVCGQQVWFDVQKVERSANPLFQVSCDFLCNRINYKSLSIHL